MANPQQPRPRRLPADQALPEPQIGASQAAGAGAVAGALATAAGTAAGVAATSPAVPLLKLHQEAAEKILERFRAFFVLARATQERWILGRVRGRMPQQDILDLIAEENARQAEFERRAVARVRRDVERVKVLPPADQKAAFAGLVQRERVYLRFRQEAMAVRALSALDAAVLRKESPSGAFWKLGVADVHTPDCLAMAGKFWPWEVLDGLRFRPPTHTGCKCSLHSYKTAVANGWMKAGAVMDVRTALARATAAKALLHDH